MPSNDPWPSKYDGHAVTICSTGERVTLVEIAPGAFVWRPAAESLEPQLPTSQPSTATVNREIA